MEYFSASLARWIPARVVRPGRGPGTLDLDCKESVDLQKIRLVDGGATVAAPAVPVTLAPAAAASVVPAGGVGAGPLGLRPGDTCFYYSTSARDWILAKALRFRPEDSLYDLDVKQSVRPESIFALRENEVVEYHSASTQQWILARVLRRGQAPDTFDLDCKVAVPLARVRPPSSHLPGAPVRVLEPGAQPKAKAAVAPARRNGADSIGQLLPAPSMLGKLDQLRRAVRAGDPTMLRQRLESNSALRLVGDELDKAGHALWVLETRGPAQEDLRRAMAGRDPVALEAALEAATVVGLPDDELEAAARALDALELSMLWRYDPDDGNHLDIRAVPLIGGERTTNRLMAGDVFCVSQEHKGMEGVTYLKLADGRGWAFDVKPGVGTLCMRFQVLRYRVIADEGIHDLGMTHQIHSPARITVRHVEAGGWADRSGVCIGDDLVTLDDTNVGTLSPAELEEVLRKKRPLEISLVCKEDRPGIYVIVHDRSAVTPTVALGSDADVVAKLAAGAIVEVLEVVHNDKEQRVRARLKKPAGWISLLNTESGKRWAKRQVVPTG